MEPDLAGLDAAETAFLSALRTNDVAALQNILHEQVRFVGPDGVTLTREQDLDTHRSGDLVVSDVDELERDTQIIDGVGITRVRVHLVATMAGAPADATLVYTRTWTHSPAGWHIIAAHGSLTS